VVASIGTDGTAELSWDAAPGAWVVYRVVTSDRVVPFSPDPLDEADEIDCLPPTSVTRVVDERPFTAALRHVTVWCHSGPDRSGALRSAPSLHAATSVVAPVVDVRISEDEGRVLGRWTALPGTSAVQVERVRIDRPGPNARGGGRNSVPADLDGFTDDGVEPGGRYRYLVRAAVRDGDQHEELSQAQVHAVTVTAALDPVTDLDWRGRPGGGLVDLAWKAPRLGRVEVYRTQSPPTMGARGELLDDATLPSAGLPAAAVLDNRRATADGRTTMPGVSWPAGWTKVYLTPVTTGGGVSRIGTTVVATRTDPPQDPRLVERTDHQLLTFEWPQGAAAVEVYQGVRGEASDHVTGGEPVATVTEEDYRGQGGLQFAPPLEPLGCSLHLVAVSWSRSRAVRSAPVSVDYPGLLRIRYQLVPKRGRGQTGRRGTPAVTVQVWADSDVVPPPLALVHHPTRMPLAVDDPGSVALGVVEEGGSHTGWRIQAPRLGPATGTEWSADLPASGGWLRLFVDLYPAAWELIDRGELTPIAVLDPPAPTMWSGPNGARP
jgi:hypothetical protein